MNDDTHIRAVLERGAGPLAPVGPDEVRARAGRRRMRRQGAWALGVVAVVATIAVSLLVGGDEQTRELDTVTTETTPTTAPDPTATTALRWPPSRGPLPPIDGQGPEDGALAEHLRRQRETGWAPVRPMGDGRAAFIAAEFAEPLPLQAFLPGQVVEVVDADLLLVGYWMAPGVFVDRATFEGEDFDWRGFLRREIGDQIDPSVDVHIARIESAGGLQDPIRIPEARR